MKKNGAFLTVFALEQIGVRKTFGIPGSYNNEIYIQLGSSKVLEPMIVTHELSAGYMADAASRTSDSIGTMVIVPGAGMTHSISAIAQAFIDGIPMMIISGGIARDTTKNFPLHQINMEKTIEAIVKKYYHIEKETDIVQTIYEAYNLAISGEPGPVFIEIPVEIQTKEYDSDFLIPFQKIPKLNTDINKESSNENLLIISQTESFESNIDQAVKLLSDAKFPGIYVGWGAVDAYEEIKQLAEMLAAPVSTTFQGVSVFPSDHPLHTGIGFGENAVPAAHKAFKNCDCLLAVGLKFSELASFNYQLKVPENLIHIDINPTVFDKNYQSKVAIPGDSREILEIMTKSLSEKSFQAKNNLLDLTALIKKEKEEYRKSWLKQTNDEFVSPGFFFNALRNNLAADSILVTDDGEHSLLALELFPVYQSRHFICPSDYNCVGYGIPAAIAAKYLNRQKMVVSIVGYSALLMGGLEMLTAHINKLDILVFVFKETEIVQSTQLQSVNHKQTDIAQELLSIKGLADAVRANYYKMKNDVDISGVITKAKQDVKSGKSVLIEVNIDYSRKSKLSESLRKPKSGRFRFSEKLKMLFKRDEE